MGCEAGGQTAQAYSQVQGQGRAPHHTYYLLLQSRQQLHHCCLPGWQHTGLGPSQDVRECTFGVPCDLYCIILACILDYCYMSQSNFIILLRVTQLINL